MISLQKCQILDSPPPHAPVSHFFIALPPPSSIVKWGYQDIFKPVYFFSEKVLRAQKHSQGNMNQQNKIKQTLNN